MRLAVTAALLLAATPLAAQHPARQDLVQTARNAGQFATLLAALDAAGLTQTLRGTGPYTVFAPTDEAFRRLPGGTVESLLRPENRERLQAILTYHVIPGRVSAATARTLDQATTVEGSTLRIRTSGSTLRIDEARVIMADVGAANGVIHVIDEVLMPGGRGAAVDETRGAVTEARGEARRDARELLALAVRRGAPLFNDGQSAATVAIYEVAARGVLALGPAAGDDARRALERGLREAERERDLDERAWVLRRALDDAARALDGRRRMGDALR